jgi:hypothetical protein
MHYLVRVGQRQCGVFHHDARDTIRPRFFCRLDARLSVYETLTHQDDDLPSNLLFDPYLRNSVIGSIKNQWLLISLGGRDR